LIASAYYKEAPAQSKAAPPVKQRHWLDTLEYLAAALATLLVAWLLSQSLDTTLWGGLTAVQLLR
jgi:hypothetical protein